MNKKDIENSEVFFRRVNLLDGTYASFTRWLLQL